MVDHVGQMSVKGEGKKSQWAGWGIKIGFSDVGWMREGFARWAGWGVYGCLRQDQHLEGDFQVRGRILARLASLLRLSLLLHRNAVS
jgi:hypothetical protein